MAAQPLSYTDTSYKEPSSWAGSNLQVQNDLILRPRIGGSRGSHRSKGGFYPSIMKGVVDGGVYLAPLAALTGRRMFTRKNGGGKKESWARNRGEAKVSLERYGKPSAVNVNKYAALKRKDTRKAADFKRAYIQRKGLIVVKEGKKPRKEQKRPTNRALEAEYKKVQSRRAPARDRVKWANQVHAASETLKQFKKKNPGIKRFKGNFMTLASLRRLGMDEKEFFQKYKTLKLPNSAELESDSVSPPMRESSRRRARSRSPPSRSPPSRSPPSRSPPKQPKGTKKNEHKDRALKTLRNLKKTYKNGMARVPGNWAKLATLYRKGDVRGQQAFLRSYGVSDSDVVAATAPLERATRKVNKKVKPSQYTRNQYWAAYRQAGDNLRTQGIARPKPENKRRLLESRRQGMSMGASASAASASAAAPSQSRARARVPVPVKGSPVGAENLETARETLKAVGPEGAAGPSIAQTLQFARMTKNGREANVNRFIESYAERKTATLARRLATAAKRAARDSSV